jgi:hypothetical protein
VHVSDERPVLIRIRIGEIALTESVVVRGVTGAMEVVDVLDQRVDVKELRNPILMLSRLGVRAELIALVCALFEVSRVVRPEVPGSPQGLGKREPRNQRALDMSVCSGECAVHAGRCVGLIEVSQAYPKLAERRTVWINADDSLVF